jgi:hypothetical protein
MWPWGPPSPHKRRSVAATGTASVAVAGDFVGCAVGAPPQPTTAPAMDAVVAAAPIRRTVPAADRAAAPAVLRPGPRMVAPSDVVVCGGGGHRPPSHGCTRSRHSSARATKRQPETSAYGRHHSQRACPHERR